MIDMIADYENEMYAEYISEMRASMNRYYVTINNLEPISVLLYNVK